MVSLATLPVGSKARLLAFGHTAPAYRQRLLAMGVTRGAVIEIIRIAPLGCPVQVMVRGTALTLRLSEASGLSWEPL
ncbi:MAG: ferrous iron transport protein A [Legionellaceae bacterium]|nr:ferrous iron transport protein A [Legionellaceae bacterium]